MGGPSVLVDDHLEQVVQFRVHEALHVVAGNGQVGLGERHLDVGYERPEEVPFVVHASEFVPHPGLSGSGEARSDTEPAGDDLA